MNCHGRLLIWIAVLTIQTTALATAETRPVAEDLPVAEPRTIDLATVLETVAERNPRIAYAQERVSEALAQLRQAEVLWLPSINAGVNYNKHEGRIQAVDGENLEVSRAGLYSGLGGKVVGAGSPAAPGLVASFHVRDAIFQPRIAANASAARQYAAESVHNDILLEASLAYIELLRAVQLKAVAAETLENARNLATLTASYAKAGQGSQADADRANVELRLRTNELERADEAIAVASARLAWVLSTDPDARFAPAEPNIWPIDLVDLATPLPELIAAGLSNRPELGESRGLVGQAVEQLRREQVAPLIPSVLLGFSYGGFGAGPGRRIDGFDDRMDFDAAAVWEVRNLGAGERTARWAARSRLEQARRQQIVVMDQVAREVVTAQAQARARQRQIETAQRAITAAADSYRRNLERIREAQGLPIEVLQAIGALDAARRDYLRSVAEYDEAQLQLHRALGWPPGPIATTPPRFPAPESQ